MAVIPQFFMDAVVSLGILLPTGNKVWIGTGFLVGRKESNNPDSSTVFIITNKHVVENQKYLLVRFNFTEINGVKDLKLPLVDENNKPIFSAHTNSNVDVVAIMINPNYIISNHLKLSFFILGDHSITLDEMKNTGVSEGSLVYALGFPVNLVHDVVKADDGEFTLFLDALVLDRLGEHWQVVHGFGREGNDAVVRCAFGVGHREGHLFRTVP